MCVRDILALFDVHISKLISVRVREWVSVLFANPTRSPKVGYVCKLYIRVVGMPVNANKAKLDYKLLTNTWCAAAAACWKEQREMRFWQRISEAHHTACAIQHWLLIPFCKQIHSSRARATLWKFFRLTHKHSSAGSRSAATLTSELCANPRIRYATDPVVVLPE
jgi:hypothetical protein